MPHSASVVLALCVTVCTAAPLSPPPPPLTATDEKAPSEPLVFPPVADGMPVIFIPGTTSMTVPTSTKQDIDFGCQRTQNGETKITPGCACFTGQGCSGASRMRGHTDLRSGDPNQVTDAIIDHPIEGKGRRMSRITANFQYVTGYGCTSPTSCDDAPTIDLVARDAETGEEFATLYSSPPLNGYSYDKFNTYSPQQWVVADVPSSVPNDRAVQLLFRFHNNKRNLQLLWNTEAGFNVTVHWEPSNGGGADGSGSVCDGGCVFLIVFFAGGFTYFTVGAAYNYKQREMRGIDMVPHKDFWKDLPFLVKDGAAYAYSRARGSHAGFTSV